MRIPRALAAAPSLPSAFSLKVNDGGDLDARVQQVERRVVSEAVGGRDHGPTAGPDAIKPHQPLRGVGEHDAGKVVPGKHDRLIIAAGRQHGLLRTDLVEAVALQCGRPVFDEKAADGGVRHDPQMRDA